MLLNAIVPKTPEEPRVEDKERLRARAEREIDRQIDLLKFHAVEHVDAFLANDPKRFGGNVDHLRRAGDARKRGEALCELLRRIGALRHDHAPELADELERILSEAFCRPLAEEKAPALRRAPHPSGVGVCFCGSHFLPAGGVYLLERGAESESHHASSPCLIRTLGPNGGVRTCRVDSHPKSCACAARPVPIEIRCEVKTNVDPDRVARVFSETLRKAAEGKR